MTATVADIIRIMEDLAPVSLAEQWDNVGLQVGRKNWPVNRVYLALDPSPDVVAAACEQRADMLVTHHPLLFKPLKTIDVDTPEGRAVYEACRHRMAIYSAHTNLDSVKGGINDLLAERIGLSNLQVLHKLTAASHQAVKFVVYVPVEHEARLLECILETGAGTIGNYTGCSYRFTGTGTFRPESGAQPFIGAVGELAHVEEVRIETIVKTADLPGVIEEVRKQHPYDTMAYDVYPLITGQEDNGLGRVGDLAHPMPLDALAEEVRYVFGLGQVRMAGDLSLTVSRVAVCSGSGAGLLGAFMSSGAQAFVSGDMRYHDAKQVEAAGRGLIDIGHFASEHLILEELAGRLKNIIEDRKLPVEIDVCRIETDPFRLI